jgi:hypothetical protein
LNDSIDFLNDSIDFLNDSIDFLNDSIDFLNDSIDFLGDRVDFFNDSGYFFNVNVINDMNNARNTNFALPQWLVADVAGQCGLIIIARRTRQTSSDKSATGSNA